MGRFHETLHKPVTVETVIAVLLIFALLVGNILFGVRVFRQNVLLQSLKRGVQIQRTQNAVNTELVDFLGLFIDKVLIAEKEISFEDRLLLENKVRVIDDPDILVQWNAFTHAETALVAQEEVRKLLGLVVSRLRG